MNSADIKTIYLIAICGTGMASLAGLLKQAGHRVVGSDNNIYPPMSTLLEDLGIEVKPGYRRENIDKEIDLVIVGNAVSKTNEEVLAVQELGIEYTSFPDALSRFFLEGRTSLVVVGTHGKTTTTALLSWVLHHAGKQPGFMIGGWLKNFDRNFQNPQGDFFVTEGDEYDTAFFDKGPKFLHYRPHAAILTGIEFDHADIYRDMDHFLGSFTRFAETLDPGGLLLMESTNEHADAILKHASCEVETYGFDANADWVAEDFHFVDGASRFRIRHRDQVVGDFELPMVGRHNALNALAVSAMAIRNGGLTAKQVADALLEFKGVKRRQEVVGEARGVTVIDDFAHHPTAIRLTLEGIREAYPGRRVWAVFEPRSATSRRNVFQDDLPKSMEPADCIVIAGLFAPEKIPAEDRLDPEQVVHAIKALNRQAWFIPEVDGIVEHLGQNAESGDVILVMSSGGFGGIHGKILEHLEQGGP